MNYCNCVYFYLKIDKNTQTTFDNTGLNARPTKPDFIYLPYSKMMIDANKILEIRKKSMSKLFIIYMLNNEERVITDDDYTVIRRYVQCSYPQ